MEHPSLLIPSSPEPRQADVDKFTSWLGSLGVKPVEPAKIRSTTGTLESLERPGIAQTNFLGSLGELLHFQQDWHLAYDFGDYRLTYDARLRPPLNSKMRRIQPIRTRSPSKKR